MLEVTSETPRSEKQRGINIYFPKRLMSGILLCLSRTQEGLPERLSVFREKLTGSERSSFRNTVWNAAKVLSKNVPDVWNRLAAGSVSVIYYLN